MERREREKNRETKTINRKNTSTFCYSRISNYIILRINYFDSLRKNGKRKIGEGGREERRKHAGSAERRGGGIAWPMQHRVE